MPTITTTLTVRVNKALVCYRIVRLILRVFIGGSGLLLACSHCPTPKPKGEKMGFIEFCGCVHPEQRRTLTEIPLGFCDKLSVSVSVSESVSVSLV